MQHFERGRRAAVGLAAAVLWAAGAAGCREALRADRPAEVTDLECAVESVGLQPAGGLPDRVRVTVTNRSSAAVALTLPRPLVPEAKAPGGGDDLPLPLLTLVLRDAQGHEESPVYTDVRARKWPAAKTTVLAPGGTWSTEYALTGFYFWGPSGPDAGGDFTRYFWRGSREVVLAAALVFAEGRRLESRPVTVRCSAEDWLFQKKRG